MPLYFGRLQKLGIQSRGVFHIGASDLREVSEYVDAAIDKGIFVEPLDAPFALLEENTAAYPNFIPVQALCSDRAGVELEIHVASNLGQSSSILKPSGHTKMHSNISFEEPIKIMSTTVDQLSQDLAPQYPWVKNIDTLLIDTQGAELMVLKGAVNTLDQISVVICEVSVLPLYEGSCLFSDITEYLKERGFDLFWCSINNKFYGDAIFIRPQRFKSFTTLGL